MEFAAALTKLLGSDVIAGSERRVAGGSINHCSRFDTACGPIFVKYGAAGSFSTCSAAAISGRRGEMILRLLAEL